VRPSLIALLCVTIFSSTLMVGAFPVLLPEIGKSHGLADWQLGALAGVFGLARMLSDLPVGLFVTHHLRRALVLAPFVLAGGLLLLASGGPFGALLLGRGLMGLGHTLGMLAGLTAILKFPSGWALASALNAYELSAMLGILAATVTIGLLPGTLAWNGALLVTGTPQIAGILVVPAILAALPRGTSVHRAPLFARSAPGASAAESLTPLVLLAFATGSAIALAYSMMEQFVLPVRGTREFGLDRAGVARLFMTIQFVDIAALMPVGVLSDRLGPRPVLGVIVLVLAAAAVLIAFGGLPLAVAGCVLFGFGMTGWMLPLSVLRAETPPSLIAWRTAVYRVAVDGGMFCGPFASGLLAGRTGGLLPALLAGVLLTLGILLLRSRPSRR